MSKSKKEQLQELKKLETLLKEVNYKVRYGKGNFHAGHCLLEEQRNIVINKLYSVEAKTGILLQLIPSLKINSTTLSNKSKELLQEIYPDMITKEEELPETVDADDTNKESETEVTAESETENKESEQETPESESETENKESEQETPESENQVTSLKE